MTNTRRTLLIASTALTAAIAAPVLSAVPDASRDALRPAAVENAPRTMPLMLADDGYDDDDHGDRDHGDDDDDHGRRGDGDDDDDDCSDDDGYCLNGSRNPAPAGSVAPPQNGLFGNRAAPQVQTN
ncbi:hypothetical protein HKCCE3408_08650 [Rhodobacterales bacterium HKCCE3408]|nr:hypothetical protein [Rhodobacterales bacterium HKCCE3408]